MYPRDRDPAWTRPRSRRRRPFCLIILLFLAFWYYILKSRISTIRLADFGSYDDGSKDFAILLHPRDHITRLPTSVEHRWNITKGVRVPDGVNKTVYLINGT
jgi:hypothetical protein